MKSENKRTQRDYSLAFKLAVVDQVEKGEMTGSVENRKIRLYCQRINPDEMPD